MKRGIAFILGFFMLLGALPFAVISVENDGGFFSGADAKYVINEDLSHSPQTFEVRVRFPKNYNGVGGNFIGNYNGLGNTEYFGIDKGKPVLLWSNMGETPASGDGETEYKIVFSDINVYEYAGEYVTIAIVRDFENQAVKCYINGELKGKQTISSTYKVDMFKDSYSIAGDRRSLNRLGLGFAVRKEAANENISISDLAIYSDARTDAEIAGDYLAFGADEENLIAYFDFKSGANSGIRPEKLVSTKGTKTYTADRSEMWMSERAVDLADVKYSIAVMGDIQVLTQQSAECTHKGVVKRCNCPNTVANVFKWLEDNKETEKIEYVIGVGDITNLSSVEEYALVRPYLDNLNRVYGGNFLQVIGNHDFTYDKAQSQGKERNVTPSETFEKYLEGDSKARIKKYVLYSDAFLGSEYGSLLSDTQWLDIAEREDDFMLNHYKIAEIDGAPFLMLTLEYAPSDEVLAWANEVVAAHKNYNVILSTHAYLDYDGEPLDKNSFTSPANDKSVPNGNDGVGIWEKLVSKHENIKIVLSGHIGNDEVVVTEAIGENGNKVIQVLTDHQNCDSSAISEYEKKTPGYTNGIGAITMFYFMKDGSVKTDVVSTVKAYETTSESIYYYEANRKTFNIDINPSAFDSDFDGNLVTDIKDFFAFIGFFRAADCEKADINADGEVSELDINILLKELVK